jgi:hypothetical protein
VQRSERCGVGELDNSGCDLPPGVGADAPVSSSTAAKLAPLSVSTSARVDLALRAVERAFALVSCSGVKKSLACQRSLIRTKIQITNLGPSERPICGNAAMAGRDRGAGHE